MSRSTLLAALLATFSLSGMALSGVAVAGTDEALTKKQFLKAANATCTDAYRQIDATFDEELSDLSGNEQPSKAQIEAIIGSVTQILDTAAADVEALTGPAAIEKKVDRFLTQFDRVVTKFEDDPQGMFEEELSGYPFEKPDGLARTIGLGRCAQRQG